ncbi:MAG: zf-HC2 domain-containing protein [Geminicoccaceae bacterium]|nr:zf-HC2 domain-containing protein [Geminicoccaceae bacterium]
MRAWAVTTGKQSDGGEMNCSDLERYLEACLDGGLGRGRLALLKRHVAGCRACRGRIERLCRFERDLHRRFRCMEQSASFWTPLEMSLVEPGLVIDERPPSLFLPRAVPTGRFPPPAVAPPAGGAVKGRSPVGLWRRFVGFGVVFVGLAALLDLGLGGDNESHATLAAYRTLADHAQDLDIRTADAGRLDGWFRGRLGTAPPALPQPAGARLVGASVDREDPKGAALLLYDVKGTPALLRIGVAKAGQVAEPAAVDALDAGLNEARWTDGRFSYAVVSPLPADKLTLFAD